MNSVKLGERTVGPCDAQRFDHPGDVMELGLSLQDHLSHPRVSTQQSAVAAVILALAAASADVADRVALGDLAGDQAQSSGRNAGGDVQKALDLEAHALFREALRATPVALLASEEADGLETLDPAGSLCVAIDPIDGSGNIDVNMSVGTIFSILPMPEHREEDFIWPAGTAQCAAGFVVYGPQTTLVLTTGATVDIFTLDRRTRMFRLTRQSLQLPLGEANEYAVNASNYRHWEEPIRSYIDDCLAGASGASGRDFNMRWHGALVAEVYRILTRGGLYLYPSDARKGYQDGRLRLIYEANPIAFLMECAGGAASNGRSRILEIAPRALHQHVPLIVGSRAEVERVEALHHRPGIWPQTAAPLFARRGLFRS